MSFELVLEKLGACHSVSGPHGCSEQRELGASDLAPCALGPTLHAALRRIRHTIDGADGLANGAVCD
jgi:hypothetical protein